MERNIAAFAAELADAELAAEYAQHAQQRLAAMQALMWEEGSSGGGQWRDLVVHAWEQEEQAQQGEGPGGGSAADNNVHNMQSVRSSAFHQSSVVAASNWVPLYCGCAPAGSPQAGAALAGLQSSGLLQAAGVAVSLRQTGQQWDWPNSWPPITCMLLEGCQAYCGEPGSQVRRAGCESGTLPLSCF